MRIETSCFLDGNHHSQAYLTQSRPCQQTQTPSTNTNTRNDDMPIQHSKSSSGSPDMRRRSGTRRVRFASPPAKPNRITPATFTEEKEGCPISTSTPQQQHPAITPPRNRPPAPHHDPPADEATYNHSLAILVALSLLSTIALPSLSSCADRDRLRHDAALGSMAALSVAYATHAVLTTYPAFLRTGPIVLAVLMAVCVAWQSYLFVTVAVGLLGCHPSACPCLHWAVP